MPYFSSFAPFAVLFGLSLLPIKANKKCKNSKDYIIKQAKNKKIRV